MKSSFVRKGIAVQPGRTQPPSDVAPLLSSSSSFPVSPSIPLAASSLPGVRPWVGGRSFVASGCASLDSALNGGFFLHSLNGLQEDFAGFSDHFVYSFIAQGWANRQNTIIVTGNNKQQINNFLNKTPRDATAAAAASSASSSSESSISPSVVASQHREDLKIAWRYAEYIDQEQQKRSKNRTATASGLKEGGASRVSSLSHSFDFSRAEPPSPNNKIAAMGTREKSYKNAEQLYADISEFILHELESQVNSPPSVTRVILRGVSGPGWTFGTPDEPALLKFLALMRILARRWNLCVFLTFPHPASSLISPAYRARLLNCLDSGLQLDALIEDPVFSAYSGLLSVLKVPRLNSLIGQPIEARQFLVKAKRRLLVEKLALPPELTRSEEGQGAAGAEKIKKIVKNKGIEKGNSGGSIGNIELEDESSVQGRIVSPPHAHPHHHHTGIGRSGCSGNHQLGGELDF